MKPTVSLIIPCRNEEHFIAKVIDDLLAQDYHKEKVEILIADGRSEDRTREIIAQKAASNATIKLVDNPEKIVPFGLNRAIKESKGEIIIRIDAHCEYPSNYISRLIEIHTSHKAANVGGVCDTLPGNESFTANAIAIATSHSFGVGNSYFRIGVTNITAVDTVPFGCFSRSLFDEIGLFDEDLVRNQDDEFNARIVNAGGKILLIPDLIIKYFARPSISKMTSMFYQYGLFKPLVNKKIGKTTTMRQLVPFFLFCLLVVHVACVFFRECFHLPLFLRPRNLFYT